MFLIYVKSYIENVGEPNSNLIFYHPHLIAFFLSSISRNTLFSVLAD